MRAMILAAGYGTRLWPLTIDRAKPAIPFMNRPLVGYVAEYLAGYGFDDVVVNLSGGLVTGFGGYPASDNAGEDAPLMFTGIQVLDRRVFDFIPRGEGGRSIFSHTVTDVYLPAIKR